MVRLRRSLAPLNTCLFWSLTRMGSQMSDRGSMRQAGLSLCPKVLPDVRFRQAVNELAAGERVRTRMSAVSTQGPRGNIGIG